MKLTAGKLLDLAGAALASAGPRPKSLGYNAMMRALAKAVRLAGDLGLMGMQVELPKPVMSEAGKEALKNTPKPRGSRKKATSGRGRKTDRSKAAGSAAEPRGKQVKE